MVLCPPHPAHPSSPGRDLDLGPADPLLDLEPGEDEPARLPGPATRTSARETVLTTPTRPRRKPKRTRLVMATALTAVLAFALGAAGPYPSSPGGLGGHPPAHKTRSAGRGALLSPKNVIIQARARQRRRQRRIITGAVAAAAAAGRVAAGPGSPPQHQQRSRPHHGGAPVPASWAERLPGLAALDKGQDASISGLSCPSAGNCAIDGTYDVYGTGTVSSDGTSTMQYHSHVFVASEVRGRWRKAQDIPGLAALGADNNASIGPVSCPSPGNCTAVGYYGRSGQVTGFLVVEHHGTWRNAQPIPGLRAPLPQGITIALSCASVGNCAFGGAYTPRTHHGVQAFADSETNGKLGKAQPIPGLAGLAKGASSYITVISCASAGNCGLTGNYIASGAKYGSTPFVTSQVSGTWGDAQPVPGLAALDHGTGAMATTVSCPAPSECTAGGYYARTGTHRSVSLHAFTVTQTGGTWHAAQQVPGITALNTSGTATIGAHGCGPGSCNALSCGSAGSCSAGGQVVDTSTGTAQAFTVAQTGGTWHAAQQVPGITALNTGHDASIQDVSCPVPLQNPSQGV
jgi:hypothetical protein